MNNPSRLSDLLRFRADFYASFGRRRDALFELTDAALRQGTLDAKALRGALACSPLVGGEPVFAVDASVWPRCDAEASPERGFYYHPSRHSEGQPIVAGWAHQWLAQLSFARDSWTAPLDVRRVRPTQDANRVAVEQIKALVTRRPPAAALGVRRMSVTYCATGVFTPRPAMVEGVAAFLGIEPEAVRAALAHGEGDPAEPIPIVVAPYMPPASPFPRWLRERLAERGWSRDVFGMRVGVYPREVDYWRDGRKAPLPAHVAAIAVAPGVEEALVGGLAYGGNSAHRSTRGWRAPAPQRPSTSATTAQGAVEHSSGCSDRGFSGHF